MTTLFISDLHLEDLRPEMTDVLLRFLDTEAQRADALYILGDLFEFWIGDDASSDTARRVSEATRAISDAGVPGYFIHGNRDFLLGESWASEAGLTLLPDEHVIDLYGHPTLLLHGDTLCTDDIAYQAFRDQVRDPDWQTQFLKLSVEQRLDGARNARDASKQHTSQAPTAIMDVNTDAVADAFRRHGVNRIIHGHTHRPAFHNLQIDGAPARRVVLADWYNQGSVLRVTATGESMGSLE